MSSPFLPPCRHVAHVMPWPGVGGTEHATLRLMRAVGEGFRHTAFCLDDASSVEAFFRHEGIETGRWAPTCGLLSSRPR